MKILNKILNHLEIADILWPKRCLSCGVLTDKNNESCGAFCDLCFETLLFPDGNSCLNCGVNFDSKTTSHICGNCIKDPPAFSKIDCAVYYGGAAAGALTKFKYGANPSMASFLAGFMLSSVHKRDVTWEDLNIVVPVPLYVKRLKQRGFNQSALLAREIAKETDVRFVSNALKKTKDTPAQAGLKRFERIKNVKGSFFVTKPELINGKKILLVDDVVTSTATVREVSKILKKAGASNVRVFCYARAID